MELTNYFLESREYQDMKKKYEKTWFKLRGEYMNVTEEGEFVNYSTNNIKEYFINKQIKISVTKKKITKNNDAEDENFESKTNVLYKSFFEVWRHDEKLKEYNKLEFRPDVLKVPASTYNLFTGFNHFEHLEPVNVDLTVILDHINCLCGYQEEMYLGYIAFLAHIVQRPYELTHSTHIFISEQGVGKDTHNEFITNVFSEKYCLLIDSIESVVGKFNSLLGGKLLVCVNEANPTESKERESKIKHLITADKVVIEKKHKDAIQTKNYSRLFNLLMINGI